MVRDEGFEPPLAASETVVLPLDESRIGFFGSRLRIRTCIHGFRDRCPTIRRFVNEMAPGSGIEPAFMGSKAIVLPLDDPGVVLLCCVIARFFLVATALISRFPAPIAPEILFLFHVTVKCSNQWMKCFEFSLNLYFNDVVTESNTSIQSCLAILAVQENTSDAATFSQ